MMNLTQSNLEIFDSTFENVESNYFISMMANPNSNYSATLQNISYNISNFFTELMFFSDINVKIVNSTFENNSCHFILYATSSAYIGTYSITLQNIKIKRNNILYYGIGILYGIINLSLDSFEYNGNVNLDGEAFRVDNHSGGNITFLNSVVFRNNYVGKNYKK